MVNLQTYELAGTRTINIKDKWAHTLQVVANKYSSCDEVNISVTFRNHSGLSL